MSTRSASLRIVIAHNAVAADAAPDDRDVLVQRDAILAALTECGHGCQSLACTLDLETARRRLLELRPDVVFNLVESLGGSDRLAHLFPALLETLAIPYTGNTAAALWLTNNKPAAKRRLVVAGLPTPAQLIAADPQSLNPNPQPLAGRFIIKAIWEHASFGLRDDAIVDVPDAATLRRLVAERSARLGRECFAEQFIAGREFNLSLLCGQQVPSADAAHELARLHRRGMPGGDPGTQNIATVQVLPPAEIDFSAFPPGKPRIVGFEAKWDAQSFEFQGTPRRFDFPPADQPLLDQLRRLALRCWEAFDLRGYVRVDFRVDEAGQPWILEINTNPCLSPDAGYAAALHRAGIRYADAIERIVEGAMTHYVQPLEPKPEAQLSAIATAAASPEGHSKWAAVRVRPELQPTDLEAIRRIVDSTGFFNPAESRIAVELAETRLARGEASGYHFLFADLEGAPVAYACYGPIDGTVGSFDLYWIAVEQQHRRRRLGRLLLDETERLIRAAGGRRIYIETSNKAQYAPTREFYVRCNYQRAAVLDDFYGPGDDKVIYVKVL